MGKEERPQDLWARLRFSVVGHLLANPPGRGELRGELEKLSNTPWRHPVTGQSVRFGYSTIERWFYVIRNEVRDPVGKLRRRVRKDAGAQPSLGNDLRAKLHAQYQAHKGWSWRLHYDNLGALVEKEQRLGVLPSYATVCRYMRSQGLSRTKRKRGGDTPGARRAQARFDLREVRSYEVAYVNGLWHLDFHHGSRNVLTPLGEWMKPVVLGILDDHSRLCCHVQWYLAETAENLDHGLSQAIQKRDLPRSLMTDNGGPMRAGETQAGLERLGICYEPTLPYSPEQNAKQEFFWSVVEGRLMAMLEGVDDLTLTLLNDATQSWVEMEYNRHFHSEIGMSPLERFLEGKNVGRPSPTSEELRRAFRVEVKRTQRKSDGTLSLESRRFEVPSRYRHMERLTVRYATWDLSVVDLVEPRSGEILCPLYPLDKTKNAEGLRRRKEPISTDSDPSDPPPTGMAPLLEKLLADYAATGLPPAYIPKFESPDKEEPA